MNAQTLKALKGSIRKWEEIVAGTGKDMGIYNCPLCVLFFERDKDYSKRCIGCPVRKATGEPDCSGSPYDNWDYSNELYIPENEEATAAAQAELDFLKSLLPKATKRRKAK